jgi:large subunit ribosomal protein L23
MMASSHDIIVRPIITEKSSRMMSQNKYSFEVLRDANKIEIRRAVEDVFKVKVSNVRTISVHPKPKRMGRFTGRTRAWKKAIVTLLPGQRIEFFDGAGI